MPKNIHTMFIHHSPYTIITINHPPIHHTPCLVDDEDEVDDDVEEGLAEDHQHDERHTKQAAEELCAEHGAA